MANTIHKRMQCVAHQGGALLAPSNTLAAFRNALTMGADALELDVHMSRDGKLVVCHDNTVEQLTDGEGNILDLDFAYLRSLNAAARFPGGWPQTEQIPTLKEVLQLAKGRIQVYIELKRSQRDAVFGCYPRIAEVVVNEVCQMKMVNQVLIISLDWDLLHTVKMLEPRLQTGVVVREDLWDAQAENALALLVEDVKRRGCHWIDMRHTMWTEEMPAFFHKHGLKLGVWTVDSLEEMRTLAAAGVDSLTTNRPDLFSQI